VRCKLFIDPVDQSLYLARIYVSGYFDRDRSGTHQRSPVAVLLHGVVSKTLTVNHSPGALADSPRGNPAGESLVQSMQPGPNVADLPITRLQGS